MGGVIRNSELFKKRGLTMVVNSYYGNAPTNKERRKC